MAISLEDFCEDIISKAQQGLQIEDHSLLAKAGVTPDQWRKIKAGQCQGMDDVLRKIAPHLNLAPATLVESAHKSWKPQPHSLPGLACCTTDYFDMKVNAYLVWDPSTRKAAAFDTGADATPLLREINSHRLSVSHILLTHTHGDHIADLELLRAQTGAQVHVSFREPIHGAQTFQDDAVFQVGPLSIETRLTSGHSVGGTTYVISGLDQPVAVVGDALFAGSMGGGKISFNDALENNRKKILTLPDDTILCPGHGPITTVGEEKLHNPFFPEFQQF